MPRRLFFLVMALLTMGNPLFAAREKSDARGSMQPANPQAQVMLNGKTLFPIRERLYSFTPADRARTISEKIARLAGDPLFRPDSITTSDTEASSDIVSGDMIIMSVTDRDALAEGKSRPESAKEFARIIRAAIEEHNREYSVNSILTGALYAFLTTLVLIALLVVARRVFAKIYSKIESLCGSRIRTIRIQSFEIVHAERITSMILATARGCRILVTITLFYFYIPVIFSFFPWTRGYAGQIFQYIVTPLVTIATAVANYLPNLFFIAVIGAVAHLVIRFTSLFFAEVGKGTIAFPGFYADWSEPTFKIVRFLIIAFAAIVAFPYVPGSESPAFKGVSIFFGVLFSLGSTSAVANVVSGIILTYTRAFRIGDRVKISDTIGDITEKTLLVTRIRTIKNVDITIPNAAVLGSHIVNYSSSSGQDGLILHTSITIGYDAPWRKVHELLIAAAAATEQILEVPAPFVLQTALNDFYVTYELNAYTNAPHQMAKTYSELHQNIQDRFNEAGMEIMSPHYSQIRDGNRSAIPDQYLPEGYEAGSLRVFQTGNRERS